MRKVKLTKIQKRIIAQIEQDKGTNEPAPRKAFDYPDEYVAYYGGKIIAHGKDFNQVTKEAQKKTPFSSFVKNLPEGVNILIRILK